MSRIGIRIKSKNYRLTVVKVNLFAGFNFPPSEHITIANFQIWVIAVIHIVITVGRKYEGIHFRKILRMPFYSSDHVIGKPGEV